MARSWCQAPAQSRSRLPPDDMKDQYHPQTGDASNLATAHTDSTHYQQIVQAGYPGEMTQRFDGEALRLTAELRDSDTATIRGAHSGRRFRARAGQGAAARSGSSTGIKSHENEEDNMSGAQPGSGVFVRGRFGWRAGLLQRQDSLGRRRHRVRRGGIAAAQIQGVGAVHAKPVGSAAASSHGGQSPRRAGLALKPPRRQHFSAG